MVVYLYERLSDGLRQYSAPSERDYYNTAAFTQQGYFVFRPDIKFQPREPGRSDHEPGEQLRQPSLEQRHRRNRSHRNRTTAHGSAPVGRPASLHPQLGGLQRAKHEDAVAVGMWR